MKNRIGSLYKSQGKKMRVLHDKQSSRSKGSKNYVKPYRGQGR